MPARTAAMLAAVSLLSLHARPLPAATLPQLEQPRAESSPRSAAQPGKAGLVPLPLASRGQMLYENHCMQCHESVLHIRERRAVKTLPELRASVTHWAGEAMAPWRAEEIAEVVRYLNDRYYRLTEP